MGLLYLILAVAIFVVFFANLTSILTIWFRNKAMRIVSLIFTVLAFIVYLILLFTLGYGDEIFGISTDKLLFVSIVTPLYLQCYFAIQSAPKILHKKVYFSLACLIIVRLLSNIVGAAADVLYRNSLEEIAQALWKVNSYVFAPLLYAGMSYVFAKIFYPNLKVFKELIIKTLTFFALVALADELLTLLIIYTKFKEFFVYDVYTYPLILVISLYQIGVGCLLGSYLFKNKHENLLV